MTDVLDPQGPVIAPVPRVTIQAFCETPEVASAIEASAGDRRMQKAHVRVQTGGAPAAAAAFSQAPRRSAVTEAPS
jgi:pilus assembly protein CpaE